MSRVEAAENTCAESQDWNGLVERIRRWSSELGFARIGISDVDVSDAAGRLDAWLEEGRHGEMAYRASCGIARRPGRLLPGACA
jgi:epoxyqueuosine reductase